MKTKEFSGDSCGDPPVPMPNTVVKPANAESTWMEASWEDREPLITKGKEHREIGALFFVISGDPELPPQGEVTYLRIAQISRKGCI